LVSTVGDNMIRDDLIDLINKALKESLCNGSVAVRECLSDGDWKVLIDNTTPTKIFIHVKKREVNNGD
jgi:hypothetical protein